MRYKHREQEIVIKATESQGWWLILQFQHSRRLRWEDGASKASLSYKGVTSDSKANKPKVAGGTYF